MSQLVPSEKHTTLFEPPPVGVLRGVVAVASVIMCRLPAPYVLALGALATVDEGIFGGLENATFRLVLSTRRTRLELDGTDAADSAQWSEASLPHAHDCADDCEKAWL
jgi:hypothetical protein